MLSHDKSYGSVFAFVAGSQGAESHNAAHQRLAHITLVCLGLGQSQMMRR